MPLRCLPLLFVLACATACSAQSTNLSEDTPVDTLTLKQWLHGTDPRLVAWAVTLARRDHNAAVVGEIPDLLDGWTIPVSHFHGQAAQWRASLALVDTLIQEKVPVTPAFVRQLEPAMPVQALLLAMALPESDRRPLLISWSQDVYSGWNSQILTRVSSMLLAKQPAGAQGRFPLSFAGNIVADSRLKLEITVNQTGTPRDILGMGSSSCDTWRQASDTSWPRIYSYGLYENPAPASGAPVVELDGDAVFSRRDIDWGSGGCVAVAPLNDQTRHRLLAYWLGVKPEAMPWQPNESAAFAWSDNNAFRQWLGGVVAARQARLRDTAQALRKQGILTEEDVTPQLVVIVHCDMDPCPITASH